jgi:hypothetical protein
VNPLCRNCGWMLRRGPDGQWTHRTSGLCPKPEPAVQITVDKTDDEILAEHGIEV